MNRPSLDKFQPMLMDDGIQIVNSSLIDAELVDKERIKSYMVPCNDIADKLGNTRLANMVALGAFIKATGIMDMQAVIDSLERDLSSLPSPIPKTQKPPSRR